MDTPFAPPENTAEDLPGAARRHVLQLWNEHHDPRLVYHNFAQAAAVAAHCAELAQAENLPAPVAEIARIAAWFHNAGYLYDARRAAETGALRAEFFLAEQHCPPEKIQQVRQCILEALGEPFPQTPEAQVLHDAVQHYDWLENFDTRAPLLRLERAQTLGETAGDAEWRGFLLDGLRRCRFFTAEAKTRYEPLLAARLLALETPAMRTGQPRSADPFDRLARRPLRSSIQTYYRANYANHIRLSAIADNKAHIMISVNSILLSVAISMLTYQSLTNKNPLYVLPIVLFLVTSLCSLIFAVLSSRPRVSSPERLPSRPPNPVFFGNFVHLSLEQYEAAVDAMLRDGRLLFGNMTRDLYFLGQVLDRKYRLLTFSYTVFMMGFVATVGAFLGAYFLGG